MERKIQKRPAECNAGDEEARGPSLVRKPPTVPKGQSTQDVKTTKHPVFYNHSHPHHATIQKSNNYFPIGECSGFGDYLQA
jgi:hypothetical protein